MVGYRKSSHALSVWKWILIFKLVDTCCRIKPKHLITTLLLRLKLKKLDTRYVDNESIVTDKKKIIVLGSGPNRIGQGIEFDYSCTEFRQQCVDTKRFD
jgi:hypothetical protein